MDLNKLAETNAAETATENRAAAIVVHDMEAAIQSANRRQAELAGMILAMGAIDQERASFYGIGPRLRGAPPGGVSFARNASARATWRSRNGGK